MLYINPKDNVVHSGVKLPGDIEIPNPPAKNYKLKSDYLENISDPWELDSTGLTSKLIQKVKDWYDSEHETLIFKHYPKYEPFSWADQRAESLEWNSLSVEAKVLAITELKYAWLFNACYPNGGEILPEVIDVFANKVLQNAELFKTAASKLLGAKREKLSEINLASSEQLLELAQTYEV